MHMLTGSPLLASEFLPSTISSQPWQRSSPLEPQFEFFEKIVSSRRVNQPLRIRE